MVAKMKENNDKKWVFCRFIKRNGKVLDAHKYGLKAWRFPSNR